MDRRVPFADARPAHGVQPLEAAPGRLRRRAGLPPTPTSTAGTSRPRPGTWCMEDDDGVVLGCARVLDEGARGGSAGSRCTARSAGQGWADALHAGGAAGLPGPRHRAGRAGAAGRLVRPARLRGHRPGVPRRRHPARADAPAGRVTVRVRLGAGTGVEWLMAAMAVADPDWRAVLTHGETAYDAALAAGGRDAGPRRRPDRTARLDPPARSAHPAPRGLVGRGAPRRGGRLPRRRAARRRCSAHRGQTTRWLRRADPAEVRAHLPAVLDTLPAPVDRAPSLTRSAPGWPRWGPSSWSTRSRPGSTTAPACSTTSSW